MTGWIIAACLVVLFVAHQRRVWLAQADRVAADREPPPEGPTAQANCPIHGRIFAPVATVVVDPVERVAWFPCGGCGEAIEREMSADAAGEASVLMFLEHGAVTVDRLVEWAAETERLVDAGDFLARAPVDGDDLEPDTAW